MKNLRTLIIGLILGGSLGAKTAAFLSSSFVNGHEWFWIRAGFTLGSILGIAISLLLILFNARNSRNI